MNPVETPMSMKLSGTENLKQFSSVLQYLKAIDKDLTMKKEEGIFFSKLPDSLNNSNQNHIYLKMLKI